jgi:hypothetical protein
MSAITTTGLQKILVLGRGLSRPTGLGDLKII